MEGRRETGGASRLARALALAGACGLAFSLAPSAAFGYITRPPVGVTLAQTSVSLKCAESCDIAMGVDPLQEAQLPGCMKLDCPESCGGDMGCTDANGWCQCGSLQYVMYKTKVSVISSDPSVARASWSGGVLTVSAQEEPGHAQIQMTVSLRSHAPDVVKTLDVAVERPQRPDADDVAWGGAGGAGGAGSPDDARGADGAGAGGGTGEGGAGEGGDGRQAAGTADTNVARGSGSARTGALTDDSAAAGVRTRERLAAVAAGGARTVRLREIAERDVRPQADEVPVTPITVAQALAVAAACLALAGCGAGYSAGSFRRQTA